MRQSRAFWAAFGLLMGTCALDVVNPCVGVFAVLHLALAVAVLIGYLVMHSRVRALLDGRPSSEEGRDEARRAVSTMSRTLLGFCSVLCIVVAVGTCLLTMLNLDPDGGGSAMLPVQLAPFEHALDLWAASAVASIAAAMLLGTAGKDVRRWLRDT